MTCMTSEQVNNPYVKCFHNKNMKNKQHCGERQTDEQYDINALLYKQLLLKTC